MKKSRSCDTMKINNIVITEIIMRLFLFCKSDSLDYLCAEEWKVNFDVKFIK